MSEGKLKLLGWFQLKLIDLITIQRLVKQNLFGRKILIQFATQA